MNTSVAKQRILVCLDDAVGANRLTQQLLTLDYDAAFLQAPEKIQPALENPCDALILGSETFAREFANLALWISLCPSLPAVVVWLNDESIDVRAVEAFERRKIPVGQISPKDQDSVHLAQILATCSDSKTAKSNPLIVRSKKIAVVRSLLEDIVDQASSDTTVMNSQTWSTEHSGAEGARANGNLIWLTSLALQGQPVAALSVCHTVEKELHDQPAHDNLLRKVRELRGCLEQELLADKIELVSAETRIIPLCRNRVLIGRPSTIRDVDVAINCRWLSRGERGLCLSFVDSGWFIEDLGNANGYFIGESQLESGKPMSLPAGRTVIELGRSQDRRAPIVLTFTRASDAAVVIAVSVGAAFDKMGHQAWPTLQDDLIKRWVVFADSFDLGDEALSDATGLGMRSASAIVSFKDGFWVSPSLNSHFRLNDRLFDVPVPLAPDADLEIGPLSLRIVRCREITPTTDRVVEPGQFTASHNRASGAAS